MPAATDRTDAANSAQAPAEKRPNILFLFTDDQRFDTIRALGNEQIITPHMDTLARRGTTFTHAHIMGGTCGAVCLPSRAMLMTGRTLFHLQDLGRTIPEEHIMLPEAMRQAGYTTFGIGKWHNGAPAYARCFSRGAEIFFGGMDDHWNVPVCDFDPTGKYPEAREHTSKRGEEVMTKRIPFDHVRKGKHSSDLFADAAVRFLREHRGQKPFFLYVAFMAPHDPRQTHRTYHDAYDPAWLPLPGNFLPEHPFDNGELKIRDECLAPWPRTPENTLGHIADYYAMITHVDAQIGRILAGLEETGHAENTLIVFAGDNGLAVGRHGLMGKQNLYEHSVRVPLIISGPGIPRNERRASLCYLLDIYPTLCNFTGLPVPDSVEGRSLAPPMRDPTRSIRNSLPLAYRHMQRGVRNEAHKLIEYVVNGKRTTQLFDLQADPLEMNNLAADPAHAGHLECLRKDLLRWRDELDDGGSAFWEGYS